MDNQDQFDLSQEMARNDQQTQMINSSSPRIHNRVEDNNAQRSFSDEDRSDQPSEPDIEYRTNQPNIDDNIDESNSSTDQIDVSHREAHQFEKNDYYGYWTREVTAQRGDSSETYDEYLDGLVQGDEEIVRSSEADGDGIILAKNISSNLVDTSDESNLCNISNPSNEGLDASYQLKDSFKSNKLNETFSISQDAESDYSVGLRRSSSGLTIHGENEQVPQKPKLRDIEDLVEREKLFEKYIDECCKIYDFRNEQPDDFDSRDEKMVILSEIFEILVEEPEILEPFDSLYDHIFRLFSVNAFRPLPPSSNQNVPEFDPEEDEPPLEPSWPHLQYVYHVMLRFTTSPLFDRDRVKPYLSENFVLKLLQLFESEDPRERSFLRQMVHRIYGQFLSLRSYIRKQIGNIFSTFVYENEYHNGIADLLEILGGIIMGFVQPVKEEHKVFLMKIVMPLHKARTLSAYHAQLSLCVVLYIEKDPTLAEPIIHSLLRYWPKVHSTKEVMFLNQIEEILDIIEQNEFQKIMTALFKQLARCIQSNQFQVAERVLYYWNNEYILNLINDNVHTVLPIVIPALQVDPKSHWNKTIHGLIYNALKLSTQMNQKLFHDLVQQQDILKKNRELSLDDRDRKWRRIQQMAEENATRMDCSIDSRSID